MVRVFNLKLVLILVFVNFITSQQFLKVSNIDQLSLLDEEDLKEESDDFIARVDESMGKLFGLSTDCKLALVDLTSVIKVIIVSEGTEEKIFNATKDIVGHFPNLKEKCRLPLPTINTTNWDLQKFKQMKCFITVSSFASSASVCQNGGYFACSKTLGALKGISDCVKQIIR